MTSTKVQLGGTPIQPDDSRSRVNWQAKWLQDPVFEGVDYRELIDPGLQINKQT